MPIFRKSIVLFTLLWLLTNHLYAKSLGTIGAVFPIVELDLLQVIQKQVALLEEQGEWDKLQEELNQHFQAVLDRPSSVGGLSLAPRSRTWLFDPSIEIPFDLSIGESNGLLAGQKINPLNTVSLKQPLLFYDANDKRQVTWAQQTDQSLQGNTKLILVGGSVKSQAKYFHKQVYFDQGGLLKDRFQLQHVPTLITQQDHYLKIQEVKLP